MKIFLHLFFAFSLSLSLQVQSVQYCTECKAGMAAFDRGWSDGQMRVAIDDLPRGVDSDECTIECDRAKAYMVANFAQCFCINLGYCPHRRHWSGEDRYPAVYEASYVEWMTSLRGLEARTRSILKSRVGWYEKEVSKLEGQLANADAELDRWRSKGWSVDYAREIFRPDFYSAELTRAESGLSAATTGLNSITVVMDEADTRIATLYERITRHRWLQDQDFGALRDYSFVAYSQGRVADSLFAIELYLSHEPDDDLEGMGDDYLTLFGEAGLEGRQFSQAIRALSELIARDPTNSEAYFCRAQAYFEQGNYDLAVQDYLSSGMKLQPIGSYDIANFDFACGMTAGACIGAARGVKEFFPNLWSTARGLGNGLWAVAVDPINVSKDLVVAAALLHKS